MMHENFKYIITSAFSEETYDDIISCWKEPHRFYHNLDHLNYLLEYFHNMYMQKDNIISMEEMSRLMVIAFFHDVVYDSKSDNNESKSVVYFLEKSKESGVLKDEFIGDVSQIIMDTKERTEPTERLSKIFWTADNSILGLPVNKLIEIEHKIFLEYQWVSYDKYKEGRIKFLESSIGMLGEKEDDNLRELIEYVKNRVIRVGVYAGTFNPFHVGHLNIFEKAQNQFDKVIVAFGVNPDKEVSENVFPSCLDYIHRMEYSGLVTELLNEIEGRGTIVTLLRGIRNGADLSYESNQLSFIRDLRPNTNVIFIPADKEFEHVSSSAIRSLMKFDENAAKKYLV